MSFYLITRLIFKLKLIIEIHLLKKLIKIHWLFRMLNKTLQCNRKLSTLKNVQIRNILKNYKMTGNLKMQ